MKLGFLASHRGSSLEAVAEACATIHLADAEYDHGPILAQCRVTVLADDTVDSLAARVLAREHVFLVETLAQIVAGTLRLP